MPWPMIQDFSTGNCLVLLAATVAVVTVLYKRHEASLTSKNGIPLPPGPPARWFWESGMPTANVTRVIAGLVAEYGPVLALRQGSEITIVIGRVDAAFEIMEKEGAVLADRPRMIAAAEIMTNDLRFVFLRNGDRLRRYRKAAHTHLQAKATVAYQIMQMEDARNVIIDILNDPKNHRDHAQRYSASVMLHITYGRLTPTSNDDPVVANVYRASLNFQLSAHPGAFLVDRIPLLRYVPGYGGRLKEFRNFESKLYNDLLHRVELEVESNQGGDSFTRSLLENVDEHGLSKDEMAYLAGDLFAAGAGTTSAMITCMILAAACYPEAQRRVQEQLDMVVGRDRLPTWKDSELLTEVHAFISEAFRWRPVTPLGFAHRATRDIFWKGHWIPEGATVLACHWALSQDPVAFPDPDKFDPRRWIDEKGQLRNDISAFPFGFGRRVCPGQYLANKSLYINLALLLWSFNIVERADAPIDRNGFTDSVVSIPPPFEADFVPRMDEGRLREMITEFVM